MAKRPLTPVTLERLEGLCEWVGACLEWQGAQTTNGYPYLSHGRHTRLNPRLAVFNLRMGQAHDEALMSSDGRRLRLATVCNNKLCLAQDHLTARTESQIAAAAAERGAFSTPHRRAAVAAGVRAKRANLVLDMAAAQAIRADVRPQHEKAAAWGVSRSLISRIERNQTWRETFASASVFHLAR